MRVAWFALAAHAASPRPSRERELQTRIDSLERRLAEVELSLLGPGKPPEPVAAAAPATPPSAAVIPKDAEAGVGGIFRDTTLNATVDGYYAYNFNHPTTRVNQIRGYDQSDNNFSLNQATVVLERTPNIEAGRRYGGRIDLQFGQATQTLQGNPANETRPEIYRAIFQAYGTYVLPIGSELQTDFGKFASSLGYEGNYTKDRMNCSRSFWFNYLPYYHFGFRNTYNFNSQIGFQYWLVNGANQSEDFNGFKSQAFQLALKPAKTISWTSSAVRQPTPQPHLRHICRLDAPNGPPSSKVITPSTATTQTTPPDASTAALPTSNTW